MPDEKYRGEERRHNNQEFVNLLAEIKQQMRLFHESRKVEEKNGSAIYAVLRNDIDYIKKELGAIRALVENKYVTMVEFKAEVEPLKKIIYGIITLMLVGVVSALLSLVLRKQ